MAKIFSVNFVVFVLLVACTQVKANTSLSTIDTQVLIDFLTAFPSLRTDYLWNDNTSSACDKSWAGVACDDQNPQRISELFFSLPSDSGSIPDSVGNLASLTSLDIQTNFTGPMPRTIQGLRNLRTLKIRGSFSSSILKVQTYPDLSMLTNLTTLYFTNMNFSGSTLETLSSMTQLTSLMLSNTHLSGAFPAAIQHLTKLTSLYLDGNTFTGVIPSWIGRLGQLQVFFASGNALSSIPTEIANLTQLTTMALSYNRFQGSLPSALLALSSLSTLDLSHNNLSGQLPNLTSLRNLESLYLNRNNLIGNVSVAFGELPKLKTCDVSDNNVALVCPPSFTVCCAPYAPVVATGRFEQMSTSMYTATTSDEPQAQDHTAATTLSQASSSTATTASLPLSPSVNTSTGRCAEYSCACSSDLTSIQTTSSCRNGTWIIKGSTTNHGTIIIGQEDRVIIKGSLEQSNQATLRIYTNSTKVGSIEVQGSAQLGGTLVIIVTSKLTQDELVAIISASVINGSFETIQIEQHFKGSACYQITAAATYTPTTMSVLMRQTKKSCDKGRTVAIVVGVSLSAVIVLLEIAIAILVYFQRSGRMRAFFWAAFPKQSNDDL